jgi:hypothetical protein
MTSTNPPPTPVVPDKNQPHATEVVFTDNGWEGTNGQLNAEDSAILDRVHREKIDGALSKLTELPAPPRAENLGDFLENLSSVKETMKTIRMLKLMRASFGTD